MAAGQQKDDAVGQAQEVEECQGDHIRDVWNRSSDTCVTVEVKLPLSARRGRPD